MIKKYISRFHPRYIRSLVYMLQTTEYKLGDYFKWLQRVKDFRIVEVRKQLVLTPKARLLQLLGWISLFGFYLDALSLLWGTASPLRVLQAGVLIIFTPVILAYWLGVLAWVVAVVQRPYEWLLIQRAKKILAVHPGVTIGIAGSYGKTSMREMLKTILLPGKTVAAPPHSYNTPIAIAKFIQSLSGQEQVLIFELGEYYPGDVRKLCEFVRPSVGMITGINEAHLEKFKTLEATQKTIFELADFVGADNTFVNGENELAAQPAQDKAKVYTRQGIGEWRVEGPKSSLDGTSFTILADQSRHLVHSKLLGLHQIGPLVASARIALELGLSWEEITAGIAATRPFDHRLEPKTDASGVTTLDDSYNGNPDGVKAVIEFLASLSGSRRWYVTPGLVEMGSRAEEVHMEIGRLLAQAKIEKVVLINNSVTPFIERGLQAAHFSGEIIWFPTALEAFAALPQMTVKGDVMLLQNDWPDQYA